MCTTDASWHTVYLKVLFLCVCVFTPGFDRCSVTLPTVSSTSVIWPTAASRWDTHTYLLCCGWECVFLMMKSNYECVCFFCADADEVSVLWRNRGAECLTIWSHEGKNHCFLLQCQTDLKTTEGPFFFPLIFSYLADASIQQGFRCFSMCCSCCLWPLTSSSELCRDVAR